MMPPTSLQPRWASMLLVTDDGGTALHSTLLPPAWEQLRAPRSKLGRRDLEFLTAWRGSPSVEEAAAAADLAPERREALIATLADFGLLGDVASPVPADGAENLPGQARGPAPTDHHYLLSMPQVWRVGVGALERLDHDGNVTARLTPASLALAEAFTVRRTVDDVLRESPPGLPGADDIEAAVADLVAQKVLVDATLHPETTERVLTEAGQMRASLVKMSGVLGQLRAAVDRRDDQRSAVDVRVPIYSVVVGVAPPLACGMILARAAEWEGGRLGSAYDLEPRWLPPDGDVDGLPTGPAVFLFSDYIWSHETNLQISDKVKQANPHAVIIHGGPDCPSYDADTERYLAAHPSVDIAVRGEGEETACEILDALAPSLLAGQPDFDALADVAGLTFRSGDRVVRTADRERIADLDTIPSPYTKGLFEVFADLPDIDMAIIETNRGCPYGCTFCDWGSATNSRIRKFDLDRVFDELEWCAKHQVKRIFLADANFGIFARDVEIAQKAADLKREHGYPLRFISNYAKNTVKHLRQIVEIVSDAGILTEGLLSLQSMDDATLDAIRRSNIKLEKYEALASEFRGEGMPLYVDLMIGLPGQTVESLRADLRACVDREVLAKCHGTELLVNSPMNDPAYRSEFAIETPRPPGPRGEGQALAGPALVISSTSFTRDDYNEMHRMRRSYLLGENLAVFRFISRHVRQQTGVHEVDFIERVRLTSAADPSAWPVLNLVTATVPDAMVPPHSWRCYIDELRRFLVSEMGLPDDSALAAALAVQHAVLPSPGREFPMTVELDHDFAAWYQQVLAAKLGGHRDDWETVVPHLSSFGPSTLTVDDPHRVCEVSLGHGWAIGAYGDWELTSEVSRAVTGTNRV